VRWLDVHDGVCDRHGTPVGKVTRLCYACHREQLDAAERDSREWVVH
jgi:hypothetical protein